jgi:hypothetical protein
LYGFTSKQFANHWHEICWPVELSLAAQEDFPPHSSLFIRTLTCPTSKRQFLLSCGQDSLGWTSPSIALLYLHDRVRHYRTTVTARSVRTTRFSENIHIYRPDLALCHSELNWPRSLPTRMEIFRKLRYISFWLWPKLDELT